MLFHSELSATGSDIIRIGWSSDVEKRPLLEMIQEWERQFDVLFTYDRRIIESVEIEVADIDKENIQAVLYSALDQTNLKHTILEDRYVILYKNDQEGMESLKKMIQHLEGIITQQNKIVENRRVKSVKPLLTFFPLNVADKRLVKDIRGVVTDATGQPLIGVNVLVKGKNGMGTATDFNGEFSLKDVDENDVLVFSYIGYQTIEMRVSGQIKINVVMQEDSQTLDEVVVVGYGIQKKSSVVGAISDVSGDEIKQSLQGADLGLALTGKLPGLSVVRTTGRPGGVDFEGTDDDNAYLYIRGQNTWNNAGPLVLVDGVERNFQQLNPNEIESVSILKDASATAVYGVKGANGVILVTTIRGKEGAPKMSFDANVNAKYLSRFMHRENSYYANTMKNYAIMNEVPLKESLWNYVVPGTWLEHYRDQTYPEYLPDFDWVEEFTKDFSSDQNVNVTISGGSKSVKYFGSLGYLHEGDLLNLGDFNQGYEPSFAFDRFNFRSNLDFDITSTTKFSANLAGYFAVQNKPSGGSKHSAWLAMYSMPPDLFPPQYSDGTWANNDGYSPFINGLYEFNTFGFTQNKRTNLTTDFILNQKLDILTEGLSANAKVSFDNRFDTNGPNVQGYGNVTKYIQREIVDAIQPSMSEAELQALENEYTLWEFPISGGNHGLDWVLPQNKYGTERPTSNQTFRKLYYEFSLNYQRDFGKHSVSGLGLVSRQEQNYGSEFTSYREDWVGRATYGFDRRYNLEVNVAYNGSEKFGTKYRFGFFPSFGAGWTISNEKFFEPLTPVVSKLKLRYSNGKIGSDAGIERWLYVSSWIAKNGSGREDQWEFGAPYIQESYPFRYEGVTGNPNIHWETAYKQNIGIETGFFDDMLTVDVELFKENRTDIFMTGSEIPQPDYFGKDAVSQNIGEVDSWGWEINFHIEKRWNKNVNVWFNHLWTFAKDKIIKRGDPLLKPDYQKQAGYQIGQPRVTLNQYENPMQTWNEIYNTPWKTVGLINSLPGDFALIDYNADGIIDTNDEVPYGYPTRPQFTYSPSFGMDLKNWSFYTQWYGVYNIAGGINSYRGNFVNLLSNVYPYNRQDAWSPEFNNLENATLAGLRFNSSGTSGYIEQSRAYLRLQRVELAYNLKSEILKQAGLSNIRIALGGNNLILISDMREDLDAPQITTEVNIRRQYPTSRQINLGISFDF
ncbi:TonB-dependent receptor [Membranihabitans marinus]